MATVLLVDDDVELVSMLREYLEQEGFDVATAHDGEAGVHAALDGEQDIVVLDVMMPRLNGIEALRRIRAQSRVPVLMLTAQDAFKIKALDEIVISKIAKRNISSKSVEKKDPEISPLGHARQLIKIKQGLDAAVAKQVSQFVRDLKLKVTVQIQGDELRVTGKNRDDLQSVIAAVRGHDFPVALSFINFRD